MLFTCKTIRTSFCSKLVIFTQNKSKFQGILTLLNNNKLYMAQDVQMDQNIITSSSIPVSSSTSFSFDLGSKIQNKRYRVVH